MSGRAATLKIHKGDFALSVGNPNSNLPKGWQWINLSEITTTATGHTPSRRKPEYWGGDIKWMCARDARFQHGGIVTDTKEKINQLGLENSAAVILPKDTVCLSRTGASIGYAVRLGEPMATNQGFFNWICSEKLNPKFLQYALVSEINFLERIAYGAAHHTIYFPELKAFHISVPPTREEQDKIVSIIDKAISSIDEAQTNIKKNIKNAKELFQSKLNEIFSQKGDGWEEKTISDLVAESILDKPIDGNHGETHPKKRDFRESGVPFIMASHLVDGEVNQNTCHFISREQADSLRKGFALDGDILLSHKGTIGRVAILNTDFDYVMLTPQVTYYRILDHKKMVNQYLYYYLKSPNFQNPMNEIAGIGSTRAYIGITKQQSLKVRYPKSLEKQRQIASILDELSISTTNLISSYSAKISALQELKRSILQKAFAGELTSESKLFTNNEVEV
ncbi:MAG: restriction endonuclease subunit S [Bacteroidota bacterium]